MPNQKFVVCIAANDDSTYSVYTEQPDEDEGAEDAGSDADAGAAGASASPGASPGAPSAPAGAAPDDGSDDSDEGAEPGMQTVDNVKSALTLALEALKNDGQMGDQAAQEQAFNQNFGSGGSGKGSM